MDYMLQLFTLTSCELWVEVLFLNLLLDLRMFLTACDVPSTMVAGRREDAYILLLASFMCADMSLTRWLQGASDGHLPTFIHGPNYSETFFFLFATCALPLLACDLHIKSLMRCRASHCFSCESVPWGDPSILVAVVA